MWLASGLAKEISLVPAPCRLLRIKIFLFGDSTCQQAKKSMVGLGLASSKSEVAVMPSNCFGEAA